MRKILMRFLYSPESGRKSVPLPRIGKCLRQVEHILGHLWHRYSIAVNKVMMATVHYLRCDDFNFTKGNHCLLKNTSTKYNKYVVNQKLEHIDDISFRELFGRIRVFYFYKIMSLPTTRYLYLRWPFIFICRVNCMIKAFSELL